jgi:FkbM family methyltransferase
MLKTLITRLTCHLLSALRNFENVSFTREEIRSLRFSFSQFGEDIIISRFLRNLKPSKGIYIDCGAFDPIAISNTLLLHKRGYVGINIDLDEDKINKFNKLRPNDYNIVAALLDKRTELKLLRYPGRATNRLAVLNEMQEHSIIGEAPVSSIKVTTTTLTEVIKSSPFSGKEIHFLNIDCEGHDLVILKGLNFSKYQPQVISIEAHNYKSQVEIQAFLSDYSYRLSGMTDGNLIFTSKDLSW